MREGCGFGDCGEGAHDGGMDVVLRLRLMRVGAQRARDDEGLQLQLVVDGRAG